MSALSGLWIVSPTQPRCALVATCAAGDSELAKSAKDKADTEDKLASLAAAIDEMSAWRTNSERFSTEKL